MSRNAPNAPKESGRENFNLKVWFYDNYVDEETGEVLQKEFVYVGKQKRTELFKRGIRIENELDCLLYILHKIQLKCEKVVCWDNNKPIGSPMREVFRIEKGVPKKEIRMSSSIGSATINIYHLDRYETHIKKFIPDYKIIPHQKQTA